MKRIYLLPNLMTTASLFFGLLALVNVTQGQMEKACWLILLSVLLDGLDGMIARLTHTESFFGLNYDSLSDVVAFGVTPTVLILTFLSEGIPSRVVSGVCILYTICAALRLARFNVQVSREEYKRFTGLPVPAAAGVLATTVLVTHNLPDFLVLVLVRSLPILMVALAFLMVSKITYPNFKNLQLKKRRPFDFLVIVTILAVIVWLIDRRDVLAYGCFIVYLASGLASEGYGLLRHRNSTTLKESSKPQAVQR